MDDLAGLSDRIDRLKPSAVLSRRLICDQSRRSITTGAAGSSLLRLLVTATADQRVTLTR